MEMNKLDEKISVFIPAYNEEKIIKESILKIHKYLKNNFKTFELVLVDDSSTDNTNKLAKELSKRVGLRIIRFENGPSRRENLGVAFRKSKYDLIMFMDLDLATDISHLRDLVTKLSKEKYDIAIGSRYKGIAPKREFSRLLISKAYNFFMRIFFGSKISDHQCGFKAFKKRIFLEIIDKMDYDKKFRRGWFWDAEILIRAQKYKYKIAEIPVKWKFGTKSTFNIKREIKMIPYLVKLRFKI